MDTVTTAVKMADIITPALVAETGITAMRAMTTAQRTVMRTAIKDMDRLRTAGIMNVPDEAMPIAITIAALMAASTPAE